MQLPVQITFRDIPPSEAIEARIRKDAAKLDRLEVGDEVRFAEEEGEKGLQASTVRLVGKPHLLS